MLSPRTQAYEEFDVVDSVASQVYFGANTEDDVATRAVMETEGILALYDNEPILTLYSSTAGGYTHHFGLSFCIFNYEQIFLFFYLIIHSLSPYIVPVYSFLITTL